MPLHFTQPVSTRALRVCAFLSAFSFAAVAGAEGPCGVYDVRPVGYTESQEADVVSAGDFVEADDEVEADDDHPLGDRPAVLIDGRSCNSTTHRGRCRSGCGCSKEGAGGADGQDGDNADGTGGLGSEQSFAGSTPTTTTNAPVDSGMGGGDFDMPFIANQFLLGFDDPWDNNAPDRAEYFFAGPAKGPTNGRNRGADFVNYQAIRTYLELRLGRRLSVFAAVPVQFDDIHFAGNDRNPGGTTLDTSGLADMNAGFKFALLANRNRYLTFQLRTYIPTGNSFRGLGTNHVSLEPSLLYWRTLSSRAFIQGQFSDWAPAGGSNFAGNVLSYGGAFGYVAYRRYSPTRRGPTYLSYLPSVLQAPNQFVITPILETIGWTVLSGQELFNGQSVGFSNGVATGKSAAGITIINLQAGVRFTKGLNSVYTGWAHGLTHDVWYRNMFRLEYRRFF